MLCKFDLEKSNDLSIPVLKQAIYVVKFRIFCSYSTEDFCHNHPLSRESLLMTYNYLFNNPPKLYVALRDLYQLSFYFKNCTCKGVVLDGFGIATVEVEISSTVPCDIENSFIIIILSVRIVPIEYYHPYRWSHQHLGCTALISMNGGHRVLVIKHSSIAVIVPDKHIHHVHKGQQKGHLQFTCRNKSPCHEHSLPYDDNESWNTVRREMKPVIQEKACW